MPAVSLEYRSVRILAEQLGKIPEEMRRDLRPALLRGARPIVADAKGRAAWSSRIPGAITASPRFGGRFPGLYIRASLAKAPHARAYEHLGEPGTFRHPVFGTGDRRGFWSQDTWVAQAARPFLFPAARAGREQIVDAIADAIDTAVSRGGFQ